MFRPMTLVLIAVTLAFAACGGGGGGGDKNKTDTPGDSSPEGATATPRPTVQVPAGLPEIVTSAALLADPIEMARLTFYQQVPCAVSPAPGAGAPPQCRDTETDGQAVDVLPASDCETVWVRPEQVPQVYEQALSGGTPRVVAAYKPKALDRLFGQGFQADTVVVLTTQAAGAVTSAVALHIRDGRIAWLERGCQNPSDFVAPDRIDSFIIQPTEIAAASPP